ncbi:hypothetical protein DYB32_009227 [Aphanomyces invadans]|uniref:VWFA domain-containing protein n=1 Tax=Aphanomyces invadans TaxID=157072 RepID=A0A418AJ28_9STRA|nr:hypothetical protein DYB32_009227 [Aphanomyces invadans]
MRSPLAEITRKVDVGSRFDAAKKAIQGIVNQKLLFRKNDEVGIVMYGTEGTDNQLNSDDGNNYKNVTVLSSITPVSLDLAKQLQAMEAASVETPADVLDGIIVALDLVIRRTDNKKYDKRLVVITDAATRINNPSDMEVVCTMIQNLETTKMRGSLEFGENLFIPVYVFGKVLEATIPSLQKESQVAKKSSTFSEDDVPGKVRMERSYFATVRLQSLKLLTTRGLKVLGFVDKSQWKHGLGMTGTDAVFGDFTKPKAQEALHALSTAMHNEGKFALARFVRAANAAPKIVALFPNRSLFEPALPAIQAFDRAFQLKEAAKAKDNKKKSFWSDIKVDAKVAAESGTEISAIPAEASDGGGDDDGDLDLDVSGLFKIIRTNGCGTKELLGEDVTAVGSMNPISDFEALLSTKQLAKSQLGRINSNRIYSLSFNSH